jgi:hypothetical protein
MVCRKILLTLMRPVVAFSLSFVAIGLSISLHQNRAQAEQRLAFPTAESAVDPPYSVTVNGQSVPVEPGTRLQATFFVRFRASGSSEITVRSVTDSQASFSLRPDRCSADTKVEAGAITFQMAGSAPRIVKADGLPYLFLFPAPPLQAPGFSPSQVIAIPPDSDSVAEHTERIQSAIDGLSAAGGGTVYLLSGIHHARAIHLRSHVTLHVAAGAVLQGTGDPNDYRASHGRLALILVDHAENARICGQGIIDGLGHVLQRDHGAKAHLIDALSCRNLKIESVFLRDPGAWTIHLIGCSDVTVFRVKILGDWMLANTDGINPDMSANVLIEDCFIYSGDDALAVKTTGGLDLGRASHHIAARDCIIMTRKTSCKIGTESRHDIHDVLFENIDIVDSSRGCALWMRDGATYSDITFRNIRMNLLRLPEEKWSGEAYRVSIQERDGRGRMENILFDRVQARSPHRSILFSEVGYPLRGVTFKGCVWHAEADGMIPHVEVDNAKDIVFIGCSVERGGIRRAFAENLVRGSSRRGVRVKGE